jgi:hypothetical protein
MPTPTVDPDVVIEAQSLGYVRYKNTKTRRRWEVRGTCVRLGYCMVGAVVSDEQGAFRIESLADLAAPRFQAIEAARTYDVPVTPEFEGCCPLSFTELEPA